MLGEHFSSYPRLCFSSNPQSLAQCDMALCLPRDQAPFWKSRMPWAGWADRQREHQRRRPWVLGKPALAWRSLPSMLVQIPAELRTGRGGEVHRRCLLVSLTEWLVSTEVQFPGYDVAPFILTPVTNQPSGTRRNGANCSSMRIYFCPAAEAGFRAGLISEGHSLDDFSFLSISSPLVISSSLIALTTTHIYIFCPNFSIELQAHYLRQPP